MQESIYYTDYRWPELADFASRGTIILLPIGQTEQHGPHLPCGCDYHISTRQAEAVAREAAKEMPVLAMPTVWCGYSGHDLFKWPGVISMPPEIVIAVIENICVSLSKSGFNKIITMNSHGHHDAICRIAARKVADRCEACVIVTDIWKMATDTVSQVRKSEPGGCCHACEYETCLELFFGGRVDMAAAKDEKVVSHSKLVAADMCGPGSKVFWSTWRYQKSETGTYGCPTVATEENGRKIFEGTTQAYMTLLREFHAAK